MPLREFGRSPKICALIIESKVNFYKIDKILSILFEKSYAISLSTKGGII